MSTDIFCMLFAQIVLLINCSESLAGTDIHLILPPGSSAPQCAGSGGGERREVRCSIIGPLRPELARGVLWVEMRSGVAGGGTLQSAGARVAGSCQQIVKVEPVRARGRGLIFNGNPIRIIRKIRKNTIRGRILRILRILRR